MSISFTNCSDNKNDIPDLPDQEEIPIEERTPINVPVAFLSPMPDNELGEAITLACREITDISAAKVAFITADMLSASLSEALQDFYDKGGMIVIVKPDNETDDKLQSNLSVETTPLNDETNAKILAFNNLDQHYIVLDGDISLNASEGREMDEETWNYLLSLPAEDEDAELPDADKIEASDHQHGNGCDYIRLEHFINWINEKCDDSAYNRPLTGNNPDGYDPRLDISHSYYEVNMSFPLYLQHSIDKAASSKPDRLDKHTDIVLTYYVYPLFIHNTSDAGDAPGDYYILDGAVVAHNGQSWAPYTQKHGGCKNNIIGYFMEELQVDFKLLNENGSTVDNLQFYLDPTPSTTEGSGSTSKGFSVNFNLSASGKGGQNNKNTVWDLGGTAGFGLTWSNTETINLQDLRVVRNTNSAKDLQYHYYVSNIREERDWDKKDVNIPLVARGDLSGKSSWIWKVPYDEDKGISENSKKKFKMQVKLWAKYGTYNWWRGASWGQRKHFTVNEDENHNQLVQTVTLAAPDRTPFGVIALQNAGSLTVANIRVYDKEGKDCFIPGSYNRNETAKKKLAAGIYNIEYDLIDPDQDNKKISHWELKDIEIKMGYDESSSTTLKSTVNATKVSDY